MNTLKQLASQLAKHCRAARATIKTIVDSMWDTALGLSPDNSPPEVGAAVVAALVATTEFSSPAPKGGAGRVPAYTRLLTVLRDSGWDRELVHTSLGAYWKAQGIALNKVAGGWARPLNTLWPTATTSKPAPSDAELTIAAHKAVITKINALVEAEKAIGTPGKGVVISGLLARRATITAKIARLVG